MSGDRTADGGRRGRENSVVLRRNAGIGHVRKAISLVALLAGSGVIAATPTHAQGPEDFLNDLNSIGIGNPDDSNNFDLVGFGNAICWRLFSGEAPARIVQSLITDSASKGRPGLTPQQADAALHFAWSDLCPDATARSGTS